MTLKINGSASIIEGRMQEICVVIVPVDGLIERDIPISLSVVPQNENCGTCIIFIVHTLNSYTGL